MGLIVRLPAGKDGQLSCMPTLGMLHYTAPLGIAYVRKIILFAATTSSI
jgi:hypothetical protein